MRLQGGDKSLWDEARNRRTNRRKSSGPLHFTDLQLSSEKVWNRANHLVARLEKGRAAGLNVSFDFNPLLPLQPNDLQTFMNDPSGFISTSWVMDEETLQQEPEAVVPPTLPLSQLVAKRSALAAAAFGLKGRGKLEKGAFADLVLIKPGESMEALRNLDKFQQSISQVWVNGQLAFDGKMHAPAGRPLYGSPPSNLSE
ncbi:MAG: amidohydrolase family protein [Bdellovibrionota bacterium]